MRAFVQYLQPSAIDPDKLIPVCGDRGVVILDGRHNLTTWIRHAKEEAFNRGRRYPDFEIHKGDFHNSRVIYSTEG